MEFLANLSRSESWVLHYLITIFGALLVYIFSLNPEFTGSLKFLRTYFPSKSQRFYLWLDFMIVIISGSLLVTIILEPKDPKAALTAGLGWIGILNSIIKPKTN